MMKFIIVLCCCSVLAYGHYADTYGISPDAVSRGGAVTATVDDSTSPYYNIAGLGRTYKRTLKNTYEKSEKTTEFSFSYMFTNPMLNLNIDKDTNATKDLSFGTLNIGLIIDLNDLIHLPSFISSARFGLNMGYMQDMTISTINDLDIRTHTFMRYGREVERLLMFNGLGLGFLDDLFGIGVGLNISTDSKGAMRVTHLELNSDKQTPLVETKLDLYPVMTPIFGGYFTYEGFSLGLTYKHEMYMTMFIEADASMRLAGVDLDLDIYILDFYEPSAFTLGIAYEFSGLLISFDLEYQLWSNFQYSESSKTLVAEYNEKNPDHPLTLPKMKDIFIPKVGVSYKGLEGFNFNVGYSFRPTYLPDDASLTEFNFMDSDTHILGLGMGYKVPKNKILKADLAFHIATQLQFMSSKDVIKKTDYVSDNNLDYNYNGTVLSVFASMVLNW